MEYDEVKLISMYGEEICQIFLALDTQIEWIEKNLENCRKYSPDIVEYWEKRLEVVQNVYKSFHQKVFPKLEVV